MTGFVVHPNHPPLNPAHKPLAASSTLNNPHLWVILQDLPVDELPHLLNRQLAPLKVKRQL